MLFKKMVVSLGILSLMQTGFTATSEQPLRLIVKYKQVLSLTKTKDTLSKSLQLPIETLLPMAGNAFVVIINKDKLPKTFLSSAKTNAWVLSEIRKNPQVQYAVIDRVGHVKPLPTIKTDDSLPLNHTIQWDEFKAPGGIMVESAPGLNDGAWSSTTGMASKPVVVAVLDTGISLNNHLLGNLLKDTEGNVLGWNFAGNNNDLRDETVSYHGTHVAGTIAAFGQVMLGVGYNLKILPVKIPDHSGMFYESQVINGIYWSVGGHIPGVPDNPYPAKVLNMSFGVDESPGKEIDFCDEALAEAISYARDKGAVLAVAAGNDNLWEHYNAPGVCNGTIKVASTGPDGLRAYYSNYGPGISFAAPGGDLRYGKKGGIFSTVNPNGGYQRSGFDFYQGTSMASPHAAAVAGLIYSISPKNIKPEQVEQILYVSTHPFGESKSEDNSCVGKKPCGHGILDADNAVKVAKAGYDVIFTAPIGTSLTLKPCLDGGYVPDLSKFWVKSMTWRASSRRCQPKENYQSPRVTMTNEGSIRLRYENTEYRLDVSPFRHCDVIGGKGVGCIY